MINIQEEVQEIHSKYGTSEIANYKIQLLFEDYCKNNNELITITLDKNILKENESFFSVISKIDNFLKIEPILISDKNNLAKKEMKIKFKYKKNATLYCKYFNSAFDNGKSLDDCKKIALEKIKSIFG